MSRRARYAALTAGVAVALLLAAAFAVPGIAQGWLCAFVLVAMVPIGSLALLLAHGISGGRWGRDLAPVLIPAARCVPLLAVAFLPVLVLRPAIYRWHELDLAPDVMRLYLSPLLFDARTLLAFAIWSGLAWTSAWRSQLWAALGLVAHLILTSLIPADWVLTLPPGSISAGFGFGFGIEQMAAALAVAAIVLPPLEPRAARDLAGLLVATLLATVYFGYMQFLITWYGNVPHKVHWYAARATSLWPRLAFAAFLIGAALPFLAMLSPQVRDTALPLRIVGVAVLGGLVLHVAWLTAPAFGPAILAPAVVVAAALAAAMAAAARVPPFAAARHGDGN